MSSWLQRQVWTMDLNLMPLTWHLLAIRPQCSSSVKDCWYPHTVSKKINAMIFRLSNKIIKSII